MHTFQIRFTTVDRIFLWSTINKHKQLIYKPKSWINIYLYGDNFFQIIMYTIFYIKNIFIYFVS